MSFLMGLTITLFIIVSLFLVLLILIQKGRGGGLASAFGGAGGNTAFGSKTGDVLTWATSVVFGIFIVLAVGLNLLAKSQTGETADAPNPAAQQTGFPQSPQVPPGQGAPAVQEQTQVEQATQGPIGPTGLSAPAGAPTTQP